MQRKIKFRGKRVDSGEWTYGFYREWTMPECWKYQGYRDGINYYIDNRGTIESQLVIPETVGQYTDLKDKNGKEIYEGDILECVLGWKYVVEWDGTAGRFIGYTLENERKIVYVDRDPASEIIGNIYDNPELLQEVEK